MLAKELLMDSSFIVVRELAEQPLMHLVHRT